MDNRTDRCSQLRKLHERLTNEIKTMKESVNEEEQEGVQNPVETVNIIKSLQEALRTVNFELQKCPPGES